MKTKPPEPSAVSSPWMELNIHTKFRKFNHSLNVEIFLFKLVICIIVIISLKVLGKSGSLSSQPHWSVWHIWAFGLLNHMEARMRKFNVFRLNVDSGILYTNFLNILIANFSCCKVMRVVIHD